MTVYDLYKTGELHPITTKSSVFEYCEIFETFQEIRKKHSYGDAIFITADLKCASESKVEKAVRFAKINVK
jgi:hypothetical protein